MVAGLAAALTGIVVGEVVATGDMPRLGSVIGSAPGPDSGGPVVSSAAPVPASTSTTQTQPQPVRAQTTTSVAQATTPTTQRDLVSTTDATEAVTVTLEGTPIPGDGEWDAAVTVVVAGPGGTPVPGATVTAVWSGTIPVAVSEPSGPDGLAEFRLDGIEGAWVSFTVIDVLAEGLDYDADDSITSLVVSGN